MFLGSDCLHFAKRKGQVEGRPREVFWASPSATDVTPGSVILSLYFHICLTFSIIQRFFFFFYKPSKESFFFCKYKRCIQHVRLQHASMEKSSREGQTYAAGKWGRWLERQH